MTFSLECEHDSEIARRKALASSRLPVIVRPHGTHEIDPVRVPTADQEFRIQVAGIDQMLGEAMAFALDDTSES